MTVTKNVSRNANFFTAALNKGPSLSAQFRSLGGDGGGGFRFPANQVSLYCYVLTNRFDEISPYTPIALVHCTQ